LATADRTRGKGEEGERGGEKIEVEECRGEEAEKAE
jgi:hypothetical protein